MYITLRQLSISEIQATLDQQDALAWLSIINPGAMPPPFVLRRALNMTLAGEPEFWWLPYLVLDQSDHAVVGGGAFKGPPVNGRAEVLYGVAKNCRGQGIATAAVKELTIIAFKNGATEVLAEIEPRNVASIGVVKKCGFRRLGERVAEESVVVEQWILHRM